MEDLQEKIVLLLMDNDVNESGSENYIDTASKIISLMAKTDSGAEVPCSGVLSDLAQAWDKAAEHYSAESEKQPTTYLKGIRAGASYKLESCANELRGLIKEAGRQQLSSGTD